MGYLDRLKGMNSEKCPPLPLQELQKNPSYSFCSSHGARFQKITPLARPADDAATASRWWLIHYPDREPVEVWTSPPTTHAEILERHPEAIAAKPIQEPQGIESKAIPKPEAQPLPRPAPACRTCAHVTGRGSCGEPVAAGLSNLEGVIRYHPQGGKGCPAFRPEGTP